MCHVATTVLATQNLKTLSFLYPCSWDGCPFRYAAGLIGDKWSLILIRDLFFKGKRHYSEFLNDEENIASNILADRLNKMVASGIVAKSRDVNDGKKVVYVLTDKGTDLLPTLMEMLKWAKKYDENTFVSEEYVENINKSPKRYKNRVLKDVKARDEIVLQKRA